MKQTPQRFNGIQFKILTSVGTLVICLGAYFAISTSSARRNVNTLERASDQVFPALQAADSNIFLSERIRESMNAAVGTREIDELENADAIAENIRQGFKIIMERDRDYESSAMNMLAQFEQYFAQARQLSETLITRKVDFGSPEISQAMATMKVNSEQFSKSLKDFRAQRNETFIRSISEARAGTARVILVGYFITGISLLAFAGTLYRIQRHIVTPIVNLSRISQEVSQGSFPDVPARSHQDEINVLFGNFRKMIQDIKSNQDKLEQLVRLGRLLSAVTATQELCRKVDESFKVLAESDLETTVVFDHECFLDATLLSGFYSTDPDGYPLLDTRLQESALLGSESQSTRIIWVVDPKTSTRLAAIRVKLDDPGALAKSLGSFNALATHVASAVAAIRLEKAMTLVATKTRQIQTILDHVSFGLMICDSELRILDGYSTSCRDILGFKGDLQGKLMTALLGLDDRMTEHFRVIYQQIFDPDCLLNEVAAMQLPSRFKLGDRSIGLVGSIVADVQGKPSGVLLCLSDITALVEAEMENARNHALIKMIANRESFTQFIKDTESSLDEIRQSFRSTETNIAFVRQELHTLKGNSGIFGLSEIAASIHQLEDREKITEKECFELEQQYRNFLEKNKDLLGVSFGVVAEEFFQVPAGLIKEVGKLAAESADNLPELRRIFEGFLWRIGLKQARAVLGPIEDAFADMAARLGKEAKLELHGDQTLVASESVPVLRVLNHLVRNALDHGIEKPTERGAKNLIGVVSLGFDQTKTSLVVTVHDDGRGIDRQAILKNAIGKGILTADQASTLSDEEIHALIFAQGVSTAEEVTDISGRGIGMSAVKKVVEEAGGHIRVKTELGRGTSIILEIPMPKSA